MTKQKILTETLANIQNGKFLPIRGTALNQSSEQGVVSCCLVGLLCKVEIGISTDIGQYKARTSVFNPEEIDLIERSFEMWDVEYQALPDAKLTAEAILQKLIEES